MNKNNIISRLSNSIRKSGNRNASDKIINDVVIILKKEGFNEPYKTIEDSINMIKPMIELRSFKKSGQSVQVPSARTEYRQVGLAIRILKESINKINKPASISLAYEIISIIREDNRKSINKRNSLHRRAIAQRGMMKLNLNHKI